MEASLDEAPCLYFATGDDGRLLQVNKTLCRELGYRREEIVGRKVELLFTLPTQIFLQTHLFPLLKMQGKATEIYITLQTKSKDPLPLLMNAERREEAEGALIMYTGIVVHNRKKFEDELLAAKKAAETALHENTALQKAKQELQTHMQLLDRQMTLASKQNEELRQFGRVITHDLQEPLRKLFVFTNMLQEGDTGMSAGKAVQKIKAVSEQMRSILSGLQQYVWLTETPVKKTAIDLMSLFAQLLKQLRKDHPGLPIRLMAEEMPVIEGDAEQVSFLFHEIFTNAIRFRKPELEVTIGVSAGEIMQNQFRAMAGKYQYAASLRIQVSDNGTGFDATYKDQVLELFRRLHTGGGRGVGLSLCKTIMENHEGAISIDSRPGEGTTVSLLFPLAQPPAASGGNSLNIERKSRHGDDEQTKDHSLRG